MSAKLLLLDLDGTIRIPLAEPDGFIGAPDDQQVIAQAAAACQRDAAEGWRMVGISNQGGVALGHKSLGSCIDEQLRTLELVPQLEAIYFCPAAPSDPGRTCYEVRRSWEIETHANHIGHELIKAGYRKPNPGMLVLAIDSYGLFGDDGGETWFVGDRPEDSQAAAAMRLSFMTAQKWWEAFG